MKFAVVVELECAHSASSLQCLVQGFLDIVVTECDKTAAILRQGNTAGDANGTAPHWAAVFADGDQLVTFGNFNFLPVRFGSSGINRRVAESVPDTPGIREYQQDRVEPTSLSLNPLKALKKAGFVARSMRDYQQDYVDHTGTLQGSQKSYRFSERSSENISPTSATSRHQYEDKVPSRGQAKEGDYVEDLQHVVNMNKAGELPLVRHWSAHTHPSYMQNMMPKKTKQAMLRHAESDSCDSAGTSTCRKRGRVLNGRLLRYTLHAVLRLSCFFNFNFGNCPVKFLIIVPCSSTQQYKTSFAGFEMS
jgi:hypothetical protein